MFAAPSNSGRIDKSELMRASLVKNIDSIARRAGEFAHDRALALHDCIDER